MGFYANHILPRVVDWAMGSEECERLRPRATLGLSGIVLELGYGAGRNLPHLPAAVSELLAVEPSLTARRMSAARRERCPIEVRFVGLDGARLELADASVDAVLSTWTLCTIPDVTAALAEVVRVLRPGGALHFLEHGAATDPGVARWQRRLQPLQKFLAGGCHLCRPIDELIKDAGLSIEDLDRFYMKGPRPQCAMYAGRARRRG